jgi:hypothetical protein
MARKASLKDPGTVVPVDERTRKALVDRIMDGAVSLRRGLMVFIPTSRGGEKRHDVSGTGPEVRTFVEAHLPRNLPSSFVHA